METTTSTPSALLSGLPRQIKRGWSFIHTGSLVMVRQFRSWVALLPSREQLTGQLTRQLTKPLMDLLRRFRAFAGQKMASKPPEPTGPHSPEPQMQSTETEAPGDHGQPLDNRSLVQQFNAVTRGLRQVCAGSESDFLGLGSQLQTIYAESESLTQAVVAMLSTDQDHSMHGALKTIQAHAANAIRELNNRRDKLAGDLEGLKAIQDDLNALSKQNNSFKQVAKNLKMVGLNISIESARTDESKNMFQALAEEITQLAQTVYEVAANVSDDTASAQQNLNSIQADTSQRMTNLQLLIDSADATVNDALVEVENLMQMTIQVMDGVGAKARQINEQVGQLVMGIQIHDNISQRVEHIETSVSEAVDIIDTSAGIDLPMSAMEIIYGKAYGINRLQMAQLKTIQDDVSVVHTQSMAALEKLHEAVREVARPDGFDAAAGGSIAQFDVSNSRNPVALLKRALDQLIALFDEGLDDIRRLTAAREETSETITRMTEHIDRVRDINFDIRLKALNAVIKSTRLGETGKAIEAIVNEMKEMAEQSNTTIRSVTDIMENIASASDSMDANAASDAQNADQAGQHLRTGVEEFSGSCDLFRDRSYGALQVGVALQEKINAARQCTGFFDLLLEVFGRHYNDLEQLDALLSPFAHAVPEDWLEEERQIIDRYTMAREREAHVQMLNGVRNAKNGIVGQEEEVELFDTAEPEESDSDLGDNIELF